MTLSEGKLNYQIPLSLLKNKYENSVQLNCLPQENGRWVCCANTWDLQDVVSYGATREEAIAKALKTIAEKYEQ